jgi:hypothetical protein
MSDRTCPSPKKSHAKLTRPSSGRLRWLGGARLPRRLCRVSRHGQPRSTAPRLMATSGLGHKRPYGPAPCLDRFTFNCGNSWASANTGFTARLPQFAVCSVHVPFAARGRRACNFGRATPSLRYKPCASLSLIHEPHHVCSTSMTVAQTGFLQPRGQVYYIFATSINTSTRDPCRGVREAPPSAQAAERSTRGISR